MSLAQVGAVLSSHWLGTLVTLLPWGFLTDRVGERIVLTTGLGTCGSFSSSPDRRRRSGSSTCSSSSPGRPARACNSATGRAVMGWFDASQRGLALGIRQAAVPVGRARRRARPAALHGASRVHVPRLLVPARRCGRSGLPPRAGCPSARGRRRRVDGPRPPALAPVHGQRPLCRGTDVRPRLRRPLPARRTRHGERPGSRRARRRPGRGGGDANRCRPLVGHVAYSHRPARPDRDRNVRRLLPWRRSC